MEVKAVIGANYGDEGKGLVTNYLVEQAIKDNKKVAVVLNNGGAQRGHTVVKNGVRHVFHHFGSGTLNNAPTFITNNFVVNPIVFVKEYKELINLGIKPKVYIDMDALITLPYDMMINQMACIYTGKHDSCGLGVWETIDRYLYRIKDIESIDILDKLNERKRDLKRTLLYRLPRYSNKIDYDTLKEIIKKSDKVLNDYTKGIDFESLNDHWIDDLAFMLKASTICIRDEFVNRLYEYDQIIIENGQGLLLDKDYGENSTCSKTGTAGIDKFVSEYLEDYEDIYYSDALEPGENTYELIYVSRSYLTRHGDGEIKNEMSQDKIKELKLYDKTNVYNKWQGNIRYGYLDVSYLSTRVYNDSTYFKHDECEYHICITHLNEYYIELPDETKYVSYNEETVEDISNLHLTSTRMGGIYE